MSRFDVVFLAATVLLGAVVFHVVKPEDPWEDLALLLGMAAVLRLLYRLIHAPGG